MLSSVDDVISNVNKVSSEINASKLREEDIPLTNGVEKENDDDVLEVNRNATESAANGVKEGANGDATVNVDVAEILDFIENISDKVQKALEGEDNAPVDSATSSEIISESTEAVVLTNGFDAIKKQESLLESTTGAVVDKSAETDKIDLDDDNIEIIDDGNPSDPDIVDITSDDEDRLLQSPAATTAVEPISETSPHDSNDADMKTEERESAAIEEPAHEKSKPKPNSSELSSIVIDVDDDDEVIEMKDPIASEPEKSVTAPAAHAEPQEIKTIDLDDDDDDEEIDGTNGKVVDEIAVAKKPTAECVAHDDRVTEGREVSKTTEIEKSKEVSSSPDQVDSLTVDPEEYTDLNDAPASKLPVAEVATEMEKEIIAAIDQDIDQGNNLLEEMADLPMSNGGSSEGSSSANEDEDMDPNHFASDDIILMPYDDEISKSSNCSEVTKEASSTTASVNDTICVDDEKIESGVCDTEKPLSKSASIEAIDSSGSTSIDGIELADQADENLDQNIAISSTEATPVVEEAAAAESPINAAASTTNIVDAAQFNDEETLPKIGTKNKLDLTDVDEIQPEAKKQRVDSLFDSIKEMSSEPSAVEPRTAEAKSTEPLAVEASSSTSEIEVIEAEIKIDDTTDVAKPKHATIEDDEDLVLIETSTSESIPNASKRPAETSLSEESEPTKKLKTSDEAETETVIGETTETATTETAETKEAVPAEAHKITLSPEPTKPEQKQTLALDFLKKFKKQFDQMTKKDLEDLVIEKIVEAIVHKSEYSELRNKTEAQEQVIQSFRTKVQELSKQYRDLEMVHHRVQQDLKVRNQNIVNPIKITRAVGLQVCLMKKDVGPATVQIVSPAAPNRPSTASTSQQVTKEELARRAAMVLQQQKLQKMQRQVELNKQKIELQEEIAKKSKLAQQKTAEANKNVRILHNQQLRMKAQLQQNQQSQPNKVVHYLPKATTVTVAQTPQLRKVQPLNPSQLT